MSDDSMDAPDQEAYSPHDMTIGAAYVAGLVARQGFDKHLPITNNPYFHDTQQWLAWRSGWNDQAVWTARGG